MKTLIIEDDETSLKLALILLEREGHKVTPARSAEEALEIIQADLPDLIVLDLELPRASGLSLSRMLKADPRTRHIPIAAVTGLPDQFSKNDALRAGCDAYLVKPIDTRGFGTEVSRTAAKPAAV